MRLSLPCLLTAAAGFAAAGPIPETHAVHERRSLDGPGSKWVKRGRVEPETTLPIRVGLTQSNLHKGEEWLMDV